MHSIRVERVKLSQTQETTSTKFTEKSRVFLTATSSRHGSTRIKIRSFRFVCMYVKHPSACPTSQHAVCYGLCVFSQQIGLSYSSQGEITGHVPAQLSVPPLQEAHCHRDGQHHDRRTTVVLRRQRESSQMILKNVVVVK